MQPVLAELDADEEEASAVMGASRWVPFRHVILPHLLPPLLSGFTLAFARGVGEYGSVVFISSNMPFKTEIAAVLIVSRLEEFAYREAAAKVPFRLALAVTTATCGSASTLMGGRTISSAPLASSTSR